MPDLRLLPLSHDRIADVLKLDALCLGGLWNNEGYGREIDSPNSELLVLEAVENNVTSAPTLSVHAVQEKATSHFSKPLASTAPVLIGVGCCWAIVDEAHITLLAVHPTYRRQGLAKALLLELLRRARRRGLQWATLEVRASNTGAIALYESLGFQRVGERPKYYQDTGESALILWKKGIQAEAFLTELDDWDSQNRRALQNAGWNLHVASVSSDEHP